MQLTKTICKDLLRFVRPYFQQTIVVWRAQYAISNLKSKFCQLQSVKQIPKRRGLL